MAVPDLAVLVAVPVAVLVAVPVAVPAAARAVAAPVVAAAAVAVAVAVAVAIAQLQRPRSPSLRCQQSAVRQSVKVLVCWCTGLLSYLSCRSSKSLTAEPQRGRRQWA